MDIWNQIKNNITILIVGIFLFMLSVITCNKEILKSDLSITIIVSLSVSLGGYLLMSILKILLKKKEHEEEVREQTIQNSLKVLSVENGVIPNLYKKKAIDQVFKNCLNWYNPDLTNIYSDFFNNCIKTIQKNFDYRVRIFGKEGDSSYKISQTLSYHRIFKKRKNAPVEMKCCFTLTNNVLDKILQDKTIFFREDLKSEELRQKIYTILSLDSDEEIKKKGIIELLNLKLEINGSKIDSKNITLSFDKDKYSYIMLSTIVDKKSITQHYNNDDTKYVGYTGKIKCKYISPNCDTFYCVFANPTIVSNKTTLFTITFPDHIKVDTVETMSFLPISKEQYEIEIDSENNIIKFLSKESILPRSGICFSW